jgi:hypothetical protein
MTSAAASMTIKVKHEMGGGFSGVANDKKGASRTVPEAPES